MTTNSSIKLTTRKLTEKELIEKVEDLLCRWSLDDENHDISQSQKYLTTYAKKIIKLVKENGK